jgi:hypothetical protein
LSTSLHLLSTPRCCRQQKNRTFKGCGFILQTTQRLLFRNKCNK